MLRHLFFCLSLLAFRSLAAEQIDNIIFTPPPSENWEIEENVSNSFGHAMIYTPKESSFDGAFQLLAAQLFRIPFTKDTPEDFEKWMQIAFPFFDMRHHLIESSNDSLTLELFGYDDDELEIYTLIRKVRSKEGTVVLTFSCDGESNIKQVQDVWIPIMLDSKPIVK